MHRKAEVQPDFEIGSGNVFADLGRENADELLVKAEMIRQISSEIEQRGWAEGRAAEMLGIAQTTMSDLIRGHLSEFPIDRLTVFLERLGGERDYRVSEST